MCNKPLWHKTAWEAAGCYRSKSQREQRAAAAAGERERERERMCYDCGEFGMGEEGISSVVKYVVQWNTDICITGYLLQTDLRIKISWTDSILAILRFY